MQQDTVQPDKSSFLCQQLGHEREHIIGFCLNETCKDNFPFCVICVTNDDDNLHEGHKSYCKGFQQIIKFLEQQLQLLTGLNEEFQALRFLVIKNQGWIVKTFSYKQQGTLDKLSQIIRQLNLITHQQQIKKDVLLNLLQCMKRKEFASINNSKMQIKKIYCLQSEYQIFRKIIISLQKFFSALKLKYSDLNMKFLVEKAAQILINRGDSLVEQGLFPQAIQKFDDAIKRNPALYTALLKKGDLLHNLSKYEDAIKCFDEAIKQNPKNSLAHNNKGYALNSLKQYENAIKCYDEAIKLNPNYSSAYNNKGSSLIYAQMDFYLYQFDSLYIQ